MTEAAAAAFAVFVWWFATGAAVYAARRVDGRRALFVCAAIVLGVAAAYGVRQSAGMDTVAGAYLGFLAAIGIWALPELAFLTGAVTGPNSERCPAGATSGQRFRLAFLAVRDHEYALVAGGLLIAALAWDGANQTATYTYILLWAMRLSTKLNIFLGAPNAVSALLPRRLAYLNSYFRTDRISAFFPISLATTVLAFGALCYLAGSAETTAMATSWSLLAAFLALGVMEHVFLAAPISDSVLWAWALPGAPGVKTPRKASVVTQPTPASTPAHVQEH